MPPHDPYAQLVRFSPQNTNHLRRIDVALAQITAADILPASAQALRFAAEVGTIHYSNLIEGNRLGILEARRAARGELDRATKAEIELINYVDALAELDRRLEADGLTFSEELFKQVHYETTKGLGTDGPFMPHHEGESRDGEAGVFDPIANMLLHAGSPQAEVRSRMLALIDWINRKLELPIEWPPPVLAGVLHFNLVEVHPFADGNGRTARLLTMALLMKAGYAPYRLFNFDAHYGKDKEAYLDALRSVRRQTWSQETWMQYFLDGLANEYERVTGEVERLNVIGRTADGQQLQLGDGQQRGLTDLRIRNIDEFSRRDYEAAAEVSRSTAQRDLGVLAERGLIIRVGAGAKRRYRFPNTTPTNPWTGHGGRRRKWSDARIELELRALVADGTAFPPVLEFREADQMGLYGAIDRNGGSAQWAQRLGITPPRRGGKR
jgi:Fic family protein